MNERDLIDYLTFVVQHGGSDLHLSVGAPPAYRLHGVIHPFDEDPLTANETRDLVLQNLKEPQRTKLEHEWELDFALQIEGLGRFRGNACYVMGHIEANFRHVPSTVPELRDLGHGEPVEQLCSATDGLILVTGVSGSGKSTTLCSMVQKIAAERSSNIVTVEDPIEFVFQHGRSLVRQRQVGSDTSSFATALHSALRQDADVLVISELRDLESMKIAITAAETGHLVISTLHTADAVTTMSRIFDAFPEDQQDYIGAQLANCLRGVICQHLLPRADQAGRVLASEILTLNAAVASCIRDRRFQQLDGLIQLGAQDGMHTIDDSLAHLLQHGFIGLEDALAHCRDSQRLRQEWRSIQKQS